MLGTAVQVLASHGTFDIRLPARLSTARPLTIAIEFLKPLDAAANLGAPLVANYAAGKPKAKVIIPVLGVSRFVVAAQQMCQCVPKITRWAVNQTFGSWDLACATLRAGRILTLSDSHSASPAVKQQPMSSPITSTGKRKQATADGGLSGAGKSKKRVRIGETQFLGTGVDSGSPTPEFGNVDDSEDLESLKGRRGAVRLDGYDSESDSDDDRADAAATADNDDDMFAEMSAEAADDAARNGKKGSAKLRSDQIEGQEWDPDAEDFSGEVKLTPFNMEEEMEEGDFDESGHYIRKRDEHLIHDSWLQGVTKDQMEKARAAHERQQLQSDEPADADESITDPNIIWLKAIQVMKPRESIPKALRRLAGAKKPLGNRNKWKKDKKGEERGANEDPEAAQRKQELDKLTSYSDKLMSLGVTDVYELTYEQVVRNLRSADLLYEDWQPPHE
ncbi:hypothetical protein HDU86_006636 [Geranomyces michiganensis]|nr:hypothetical protein HDU86_006636 [Geranomyces michiganensis]